MSDEAPPRAGSGDGGAASIAAPAPATATAGALLRAARQAQGQHLAALAVSIKIPQRKLEALESDRYDELPDITFTRALAKAVCRSLKIDPAPVLALLPEISEQSLDRVHEGLNTKFHERPGRLAQTDLIGQPYVWLPLLVVLAAAGIYFLPQHWIAGRGPAAPASAASAAAAAASEVAAVAAPAASAAAEGTAAPEPVAEAASAPPAEATGMLQLRASGESWVEVVDAGGATLLQRMLRPGEAVSLDGAPPFKVKVGNVAATQLSWRGQAVDLAATTRDNVARLDLQ